MKNRDETGEEEGGTPDFLELLVVGVEGGIGSSAKVVVVNSSMGLEFRCRYGSTWLNFSFEFDVAMVL